MLRDEDMRRTPFLDMLGGASRVAVIILAAASTNIAKDIASIKEEVVSLKATVLDDHEQLQQLLSRMLDRKDVRNERSH